MGEKKYEYEVILNSIIKKQGYDFGMDSSGSG
jgi:hypothetical protein